MNRFSEMLDMSGKTVIVTGGVKGAGASITDVFLDSGADVIATYNKSIAMAETLAAQWAGRNIEFMQLDTGSIESIDEFVKALEDEGRTIYCLVNNAGIYPAKDIDQVSLEEWDSMMDINARGVFFLSQKIRPLMEKGAIVNISSINATNPARRLAHYGASKAAVEMLTRSMAQAYGPEVRVNCIAPGLIFQDGQDEFIPGWSESYKERSALNKLVMPDEIGRLCLLLASDMTSAVTGQIITADCGVSLAPYFYNEL